MLFDVHAHLYDEKFEGQTEKIINEAKENRVDVLLCASSDLSSSKKSIEIANKYSNVYAVIGIHPDDCENFDKETERFLIENSNNPKVVAIGEIGLDYHYDNPNKERQKEVFIKQLEIANKVKLPIQIHSRDATEDTIEILTSHKQLLQNGGIVHCFSGSTETLKQIEKLGLKISVGGILTFKNARKPVEVVESAPLEMLMTETDCPYLAPHPHRGEINSPKYIPLILEKIAEIKNIDKIKLEKIIENNILSVFTKIK